MTISHDSFNTFQFTGAEICRMMRQNKITIAALARQTGIPQWRVRRVRQNGIKGHAACDWYEALTGSLSPRMRAAYRQWRAQ